MKRLKTLSKPQNRNNRSNIDISLKEYLNHYDKVTITALINTFESGEAWNIFRSYLKLRQREFEVGALDLMSKNDQMQTAAYASGYAKGLEDISDNLLQQFKDLAMGVDPVVENPRTEEEVNI